MAKTINELTVTTSAAAGDLVPIWRASNADTRKITKANFIGATLTGGGTVATGGHTLTVGGTSAINGTVSGGGTVATGGYTLTAPATGTAVTLDATQTLTNKTLSYPQIHTIQSQSTQVQNDAFGALSVWTSRNLGLFLLLNVSYGAVAAFLVRGGANAVNYLGFDNTSIFSVTPNNAGTVNFYYDATYGYVIQNKMGGAVYIAVLAFGTTS